jgi:hypothetical protein
LKASVNTFDRIALIGDAFDDLIGGNSSIKANFEEVKQPTPTITPTQPD